MIQRSVVQIPAKAEMSFKEFETSTSVLFFLFHNAAVPQYNVLIAAVLLLEKCYDIKKVGRPYSKVDMCDLWTSATQQKKQKKQKKNDLAKSY